jgi:hypothetical protein
MPLPARSLIFAGSYSYQFGKLGGKCLEAFKIKQAAYKEQVAMYKKQTANGDKETVSSA